MHNWWNCPLIPRPSFFPFDFLYVPFLSFPFLSSDDYSYSFRSLNNTLNVSSIIKERKESQSEKKMNALLNCFQRSNLSAPMNPKKTELNINLSLRAHAVKKLNRHRHRSLSLGEYELRIQTFHSSFFYWRSGYEASLHKYMLWRLIIPSTPNRVCTLIKVWNIQDIMVGALNYFTEWKSTATTNNRIRTYSKALVHLSLMNIGTSSLFKGVAFIMGINYNILYQFPIYGAADAPWIYNRSLRDFNRGRGYHPRSSVNE